MQSLTKALFDIKNKHGIPDQSELKAWPADAQKAFLGVLTFFMREPGEDYRRALGDMARDHAEKRAFEQRQKGFLSPGMTPTGMVVDPFQIEKYHDGLADIDLGYEPLFALVDMRSSNLPTFTINKASAGITWKQVKVGEKPKIENIGDRSNDLSVSFIKWAAAVGFLDEWFRFNQFWNIEDTATEFRGKYYMAKASMFYQLLATGATAQAFVANDITTINAGCTAILRALKLKGYAIGNNPQFDIVCPPELLQRLNVALSSATNAYLFVDQKGKIEFSIRNVISTMNYCDASGDADTTHFDIVLPGRKLKRGEWQDPKMESERDILSSATEIVGTAMFNGGKGTADQTRRCAIA